MSYRSVKRLLGETSLERKCRILFGISLSLLISVAFWYAGHNAEELVKEGPNVMGRFFVGEKMGNYHLLRDWQGNITSRKQSAKQFQEEAQELSDGLGAEDFTWDILVLDRFGVKEEPDEDFVQRTRLANEEEREVLLELQAKVDAEFAKYGREKLLLGTAETPSLDESDPNSAANPLGRETTKAPQNPAAIAAHDRDSPFKNPPSRLLAKAKDYHYYQPILWVPDCTAACHQPAQFHTEGGHGLSRYAFSAGEWEEMTKRPDMLRVMKVVIPRDKTQNKINRVRAILAAIAISTVFFSMAALYVVVRYVIVKPLNHLREVSDEIGRGNYDLRANIQTGDEFEELAASFNRMLRHMVDSQGELRIVNNDLDAKVDQLAQANMQLHEMNRLKSDFLSSMSHELRTPLNSIIGFADVLKDTDNLKDKQKRYAGNIGTSGRALLEMINDILDLAKTESGKMEVRLTEFNIDPVVHAQCDLVQSLSGEKNIDLTAEVENGLPPLYQDQGKIQQILINLLSNAIKFTPEGGRITVTARRDHMRHLILMVEDTGVGIAEEERKVIFEKFRQGGQTVGTDHLTREFSGSGLGLSIVKELSKLLGGEVSFESELGKGSTFQIRVPWTLADQPKLDSSITQRLDEVTKPRRLDFSTTNFASADEDLQETTPNE